MVYLLNMVIFYSYVKLPEGTVYDWTDAQCSLMVTTVIFRFVQDIVVIFKRILEPLSRSLFVAHISHQTATLLISGFFDTRSIQAIRRSVLPNFGLVQ